LILLLILKIALFQIKLVAWQQKFIVCSILVFLSDLPVSINPWDRDVMRLSSVCFIKHLIAALVIHAANDCKQFLLI
jgi:hypothetical protein